MADSRTTSRTPSRTTSQTSSWTAAWELLLPTAAAPPRKRGRTLQSALREAVRSGRIAAGTRLPSSRELAADLGVSRGLVTDAYEQLTAEGYLNSSRGSGTWVSGAARATAAREHRRPAADAPGTGFLPGTPDLSLFPRAAWSAAHRRVLARLPHSGLGYPDPRGLPELRAAVAGLLTRRRGVVADPESVVICSGVAQAMTLLGFTLAGLGHRAVAVEDPGSPENTALLSAAGLTAVPVPLDAEGTSPAALAASGARAAQLTPCHQFPSGLAYSARRRLELLEWARAVDGLLLEDDYDGDFRYDRAPVGALQGLDPARVAYAGSVSKSLAPGLRLGWLVVPEHLVDLVVERKRTMDLGNPALDQALLAEFIERGDYDRQLRRCQRAYRERRDALVAALAEHFPGTEVTGIAAGLHIIARLPRRYGPEARFLERAAEAGVALRPLADFARRPAATPAHSPDENAEGDGDAGGAGQVRLVMGYAHLSPARIARAVALIAEARAPGLPGTPR
ncbi:PLP-dependent aminotransferase family protein [Streptomyces sp. NPDC097640]|uniref:MocR-like pyridoxine biosynthesis transcription factor PdxR n=1 Tax=Streptomyces sp. NPDC097640 TaxID=3157229 RepID=UPI00332845F9